MNSIIDFSVFLQVPLDVSMVRRTRRELIYNSSSDYTWLLSELENWEKGARAFNIQWERIISETCDLIVDSVGKPENIINEILVKLNSK